MTLNQEKATKKRIFYAEKWVKRIGKILNQRFYSGTIKTFLKQGNETVTEYDLLVDRFLKQKLLKKYPDSWISEESESVNGKSGFEWVLDPVDGTNNFSQRIPFFCISLALKFNQETVAGIVYDPVHKITYLAVDGKSYIKQKMKKRLIQLSKIDIKESLVSYGFHQDYQAHWNEFYAEWQKIENQSKASRRLGSAALEIIYVGIEKLSLYWIMGFREWDIAAALLFAKNAGARYELNREKNYLLVYHPAMEKEIHKLMESFKNHH